MGLVWARTWSRIYRMTAPDPGFFLDLQRDKRLQHDAEIEWDIMRSLTPH